MAIVIIFEFQVVIILEYIKINIGFARNTWGLYVNTAAMYIISGVIYKGVRGLTPPDDPRGKVNPPESSQKGSNAFKINIIFHLTPLTPILTPREKCIDHTGCF